MPRAELFANLLRVYAGAHLQDPRIHLARARAVQVETNARPPIELDGEVVGAGQPAFTLLPAAIRVHVPRP